MMDPIPQSEVMNGTSPSPPPIPSSPPPEELPTNQSPPRKPVKLRRSVSPSKENEQNEGTENAERLPPSSEEKIEKVNGFSSDSKESATNGVHDDDFSSGGVAKIIDEIEKTNSLARNDKSRDGCSSGSRSPAKLEEVQLRDDSAEKSNLTPIERSVLREMPVDVDIEGDQNYSHRLEEGKSKRGENGVYSDGEESPRRGTSVKRTPTMEFKKQCSKIVRIRTKILQNLGKADKTTDEVFDEYEANFTRQQNNANRLHKEVANYLRCARALNGASKALFETLADVYEPDWAGGDLIYAQAQNSDMLWTDFVHKLQDQSLAPLTAYQIQFPELRKKIDKRGRKLVDYDSQRHQLEALQRSTRRDEYKLARCKDQLEQARVTYDGLNKELYEELPAIYDQRVLRTSETLQTLYAAETTFMREHAKISHELEAIADNLSNAGRQGKYKTTRGTPVTPRPISISSPPQQQATKGAKEEIGRPYEEIQFEESTKVNGTAAIGTKVPPGATTTGLPSGVLYQVRTTYKYDREDVDELTFEVGEVINVVEYEDPEEQEEGWLCGYKVTTNEKGLFPANFTRPI